MRHPGVLYFFKDKSAAQAAFAASSTSRETTTLSEAEASSLAKVDLRLILNFVLPVKKTKDSFQLDLEMGEESVKMRFKNQDDQERWKTLLMEWKDYARDYGEPCSNLCSACCSGPPLISDCRMCAVDMNPGMDPDLERGNAAPSSVSNPSKFIPSSLGGGSSSAARAKQAADKSAAELDSIVVSGIDFSQSSVSRYAHPFPFLFLLMHLHLHLFL